jgi:hypothetical protein
MATTTNFGWDTPDDTDLVKDGAAAIRTLGSNIDTSLVDLNGGTTGQYLQKNSGTDLDFVWADVSAGGMTLISTTALSGATVTLSSIPSTYNHLQLVIYGVTNATANGSFRIAPNGATSSSNNSLLVGINIESRSGSYIVLTSPGGAVQLLRTDANNVFVLNIYNYAATSMYKEFNSFGTANINSVAGTIVNTTGAYLANTEITSLVISNSGGDISTGTVLLYGVK